jgi:HEAT repeat protein
MAVFVLVMGQIGCEEPQTRRDTRRDKRLETLTKALKSESPAVGIKAAEALANMGSQAIGAVDALLEALGDDNAGLRAHAAVALGKICRSERDSREEIPEAVVPALRNSLEDTDGLVRVWSVLALFRIVPQEDPEIKVISDALNSEAPAQVRIEAAIAVVQMGPRGKGAVPALIAALDSSSVRRHAAYALGAIGPDASAAIGALTRISGRPGPIGAAARTAIERISR